MTPTNFFAFRVMFLMPQVCFKPITWYFEMHHVKTFFVPHHDFFVLWDVHSLYVYLQEESLQGVLGLKKNFKFVLIVFYFQLVNSSHADSSMADKSQGKLSS